MLAIFYDGGCSSDFFEETTNVRAFGLTSLCGSIGGYIGMILGLSFLQVPDIVSGIFHYIPRKKICSAFRCKSTPSTVDGETGEYDV